VGGNDLLEVYKYGGNDVKDLAPMNSIFENYKKTILNLRKKTQCNIILTDLYYVADPKYREYYPIIKKWNKNIYEFSDKNNFHVYKVSNLIKDHNHFTNSIEPSSLGGKILVDNIIKF
jgi:hypothetical protein